MLRGWRRRETSRRLCFLSPINFKYSVSVCVRACHMVDVGITVLFCHACNNHVWSGPAPEPGQVPGWGTV